MNRTEAQKFYKAEADAKRLVNARTIEGAIIDLVGIECPHCQNFLELPSLEDIQNWLEENEQ